MEYSFLKTIHVTCVAVTFALFVSRGVLSFRNPARPYTRLLRIAPHVVDTVLLASAVAMSVLSRQYPFAEDWLTAKLAALIVYIGAGMIALSARHAVRVRVTAWLFALAVFGYIVSVALTRNPAPFLQ